MVDVREWLVGYGGPAGWHHLGLGRPPSFEIIDLGELQHRVAVVLDEPFAAPVVGLVFVVDHRRWSSLAGNCSRRRVWASNIIPRLLRWEPLRGRRRDGIVAA